jgi:hypothetical protein
MVMTLMGIAFVLGMPALVLLVIARDARQRGRIV